MNSPFLQVNEKRVSITQLRAYSEQSDAIYCGATKDVEKRTKQHSKKFSGNVFYASTKNMKKAENRLLSEKNWEGNIHKKSNVSEEPGNVYVIIGSCAEET